eukprot:TRINITY_DN17889_c0_g1_i1.p1 TRINITY_DN17889_c0_g1~~TRINITY_DN17889_c0_g1_i1.p1  ORF type:complete len:158 (+),score=11.24 TRINITY_DN17889_c0_g1_i1:341-814(+)
MSNANLVIIPEIKNLNKQILNKSLIVEEPVVSLKQPSKQRLKNLLDHKPLSNSSHKTAFDDAINKLKSPDVLLLSVEDLSFILDYYDTSLTDWHIDRGLPKELASSKDLIVLTHENPLPGINKHLQDFCTLGLNENGYCTLTQLENRMHTAFTWTPL